MPTKESISSLRKKTLFALVILKLSAVISSIIEIIYCCYIQISCSNSGGIVVCCNTQSTRHINISCICYLSSCCDIQTATTSLNINATNDVFSGGSITTNALDIEAGRNFANGGTISTDSFEITAGYTVINKGSIASDSLDVTTDDFFRNLTGGDISVASLNITAGGKVTNTATIDVSGILSITANNDSARDDDPAGETELTNGITFLLCIQPRKYYCN